MPFTKAIVYSVSVDQDQASHDLRSTLSALLELSLQKTAMNLQLS